MQWEDKPEFQGLKPQGHPPLEWFCRIAQPIWGYALQKVARFLALCSDV